MGRGAHGVSSEPRLYPGPQGEKKWQYVSFVLGRRRFPFVSTIGSVSGGLSVSALTAVVTPLN